MLHFSSFKNGVSSYALMLAILLICGCSEGTHFMSENFTSESLVSDGNSLVGNGHIKWLDASAAVIVSRDADATELSLVQKRLLETVIKLPKSTKDRLESMLILHYRNDVFGTLHGGEILTPRLNDRSEIWGLISGPVICVPASDDISDNCKFSVAFECKWDPEHGIEVLFDSNDTPVEVGCQGDFF